MLIDDKGIRKLPIDTLNRTAAMSGITETNYTV